MKCFMRIATSVAFCVSATIVSGQSLPDVKSQPIAMYDANLAAAALVGRGIQVAPALASQSRRDINGNEVIWKQVRDLIAANGQHHVFYRQYLRTPSGAEVQIYGSEVGLHYSAAAEFRSIGGRQFIDVRPMNTPSFSAPEAHRRALKRLESYGVFHPRPYESLSAAEKAHREERTTLILLSQDGIRFRYVWSTFANDLSDNRYYEVLVDASTEQILAVTPVNPSSNCDPSTPWQGYYAVGYPIRADIRNSGVRRSLAANYAPNRPYPFIYEGYFNASPNKSVLQETSNSAFRCDPSRSPAYTLFPVGTENGTPTYRDDPLQPEWRGYVAGDALDRTNQSMLALGSMGRNSFCGYGCDANIVFDTTTQNSVDNSYFIRDSGGDPRLPPTSCVAVARESQVLNLNAALDVIGHEWGHGVIFNSANFPYNTTVGQQLHEGFADVIGQMTEKLREPVGFGVEQSSDWTIGEDSVADGTYLRGAIDDGAAHHWGPNLVNDTLHRDDDPSVTGAHARGNMLNVVFRLLSDGGQNPICSRLPLSGCGTNMSGLGFSSAARILFDTVQYQAPSNATWEDMPMYAGWAAFADYAICDGRPGGSALFQQNAVNSAFTAIGYPRLVPPETCP